MGNEGCFFSTVAKSSFCLSISRSERALRPKQHHNSHCSGVEAEMPHSTISCPSLGLISCLFSKSTTQRAACSQRKNGFHPLKCAYHITRKNRLDTVIKVNSREMGRSFKQKAEFYNLNHLWPGACRSKLNA